MNKRIFWIEDDYYAIKGLVRPLELMDFKIDVATSALEAYKKLDGKSSDGSSSWEIYDIFVIDLILPISNDGSNIPPIVKAWEDMTYVGIGLAKWLSKELKNKRPILLLSVVRKPHSLIENDFGISNYLSKSGLLPSKVKEVILRMLEVGD